MTAVSIHSHTFFLLLFFLFVAAASLISAMTAAVILLTCAGCAKENKYVNVGVEMSTAGMSLYLTNTVNGFQKISNYVFFPASSQESVDKIRQEKQGTD